MNNNPFLDFKCHLKDGNWGLKIGIKDHWTVDIHMQYIEGLLASNTDATVQFIIDSPTLELARKIDVYISPSSKEYSTTKHIQFENRSVKP